MIRNRFISRLKRYHLGSGRKCSQPQGNRKASGSGGSMDASLKLEGIDGEIPPDVESAAQFDSTRENLFQQNMSGIDRLRALS